MKKGILIIYCVTALLYFGCETTSNTSTSETANSNIKQFPVKLIKIGKTYDFTLTEKRERDNEFTGKFSGNVHIRGKVVEVDKESG